MSDFPAPRTEHQSLQEIYALSAGALSQNVPADWEGRLELYERRLREICAAAHRHMLDGRPLPEHLRPRPGEQSELDSLDLLSALGERGA